MDRLQRKKPYQHQLLKTLVFNVYIFILFIKSKTLQCMNRHEMTTDNIANCVSFALSMVNVSLCVLDLSHFSSWFGLFIVLLCLFNHVLSLCNKCVFKLSSVSVKRAQSACWEISPLLERRSIVCVLKSENSSSSVPQSSIVVQKNY